MWSTIAKVILRNRILILLGMALMTGFMFYQSRQAKFQFSLPKLLPASDSTLVAYEAFKDRFRSEASSMYVIGIKRNPLADLELFNAWYQLGRDLIETDGVDTTVSLANIFTLVKDTTEKKFKVTPVVTRQLVSEEELDSVENIIRSLPFYRNLLYNDSTNASLMAISIDTKIFNSTKRDALLEKLTAIIEDFSADQEVPVHYSGMPYIRNVITQMVLKEMKRNIALAIAVTILILLLFFRSWKPAAVSMLVVGTAVVWVTGTMGLFGFEITILTGIIPPLIIVIGVPNCIYLINKYHHQYRVHGQQGKALARMVQKVGKATFMTNLTTALGFAPFIFIQTESLVDFGIVASVNIIALFIISLCVIPIALSYLPPPKDSQTRHLDKKWITGVVEYLVNIVQKHRGPVYVTTVLLIIAAGFGISRMQVTGNIVDDLDKEHIVVKDLHFFEKHFNGVLPFEISIDAQKPGLATNERTLKRIDKLQNLLAEYPEFAKPISVAEGVKFTKQAFYNGNPLKYDLINRREKAFFKPYLENAEGSQEWLGNFLDSTKRFTRVSVPVKDIPTPEMESLILDLQPQIDSIFNPEKYKVELTGTSVVFLKGTTYLVRSLIISLSIAIVSIACFMALLFASVRMIIVSLVVNMIPLILTGALMGYFGIHIKPSTVLVFSIAFGISVDDTIHFLAKYRQELKLNNWNIGVSVLAALRETGVSMIYTSIVLFFGFIIFSSSEFGGTFAMGILVSFTLLTAMLANLVLLPSFLMWLDKAVTTKAFKEPLLEILDEEEDIELEYLEIKQPSSNGQSELTVPQKPDNE